MTADSDLLIKNHKNTRTASGRERAHKHTRPRQSVFCSCGGGGGGGGTFLVGSGTGGPESSGSSVCKGVSLALSRRDLAASWRRVWGAAVLRSRYADVNGCLS